MLFDNKERTRTTPKQPGEKLYSFLDSSARPRFQTFRDLVNNWISELPPAEQEEIVTRFRGSDDAGYRAALAEVTIHAVLKRQGCTVEIHPPCDHPTHRPDFLARAPDNAALAYVEVTSFGPTREHVARSNREAQIYNAINRVRLPAGWRLSYDIDTYGDTSPKLGVLRRDVEVWAGSVTTDPTASRDRVFEAGDWKIELSLLDEFDPDVVVQGAIAVAAWDVRFLGAEAEIRKALESKGSRYGAPGLRI